MKHHPVPNDLRLRLKDTNGPSPFRKVSRDRAFDLLKKGWTILGNVSMGSCECGDIEFYLWVSEKDALMCASGVELTDYQWKSYFGPASECRVSYGVGAISQQFSLALMTDEREFAYICKEEVDFFPWKKPI